MQDGSTFAWYLKKLFLEILIPCDGAEPGRVYKVMMCKVYKLGKNCPVSVCLYINYSFCSACMWLVFCFQAMSVYLGRVSRLNFNESNGMRLSRIISTGLSWCTPSVRRTEVNAETPSLKPKKIHTIYLLTKVTFCLQLCSISLSSNQSSQKTSSFK